MPDPKTPEQIAAEKAAKAEQKAKEKADKEVAAKAEEERLAAEAANTPAPTTDGAKVGGTTADAMPTGASAPVQPVVPQEKGRMFSEEEVREILQRFAEMNGQKKEPENKDERKNLRLAHFMGKYVVAFKNKNVDPFNTHKTVQSWNVFDPQIRQYIPWITVIFDDATEQDVPLNALFEQSVPVKCVILDRITEDKSYSNGKVERTEVKDWRPEGTGVMVNQKVTQTKTFFKIQTPAPESKVMTVPEDVVNFR